MFYRRCLCHNSNSCKVVSWPADQASYDLSNPDCVSPSVDTSKRPDCLGKGRGIYLSLKHIYLSLKLATYNLALVDEALKFWDTAPYAHARCGDRNKFTNTPKKGMEEALQEVRIPVLGDDPKDTNEVALIARTIQKCNWAWVSRNRLPIRSDLRSHCIV